MVLMEEGSGCVCAFFPIQVGELTWSWSNIAVVLHYKLYVWSMLFWNVSEGVLFSHSVD